MVGNRSESGGLKFPEGAKHRETSRVGNERYQFLARTNLDLFEQFK